MNDNVQENSDIDEDGDQDIFDEIPRDGFIPTQGGCGDVAVTTNNNGKTATPKPIWLWHPGYLKD